MSALQSSARHHGFEPPVLRVPCGGDGAAVSRLVRLSLLLIAMSCAFAVGAQTPQRGPPPPGGQPRAPRARGGRGGPGAGPVMARATRAWADGGPGPVKDQ